MFGKSPIAKKLTILIVCFSTAITILTTGLQLFLDYKKEMADIRTKIDTIKTMQVSPLSYSMWTFDSQGIQIIIDNILKIQEVVFLQVTIDEKHTWSGGELVAGSTIDTETEITFNNGVENFKLGTLRIVASLDEMYDRLIKKAMVIFISNGFKTFFVSLFILFLFQRLVTRHLTKLAQYATQVASGHSPPLLSLDRKLWKSRGRDELEVATSAINLMRSNLETEVANLKQMKEALRESEERFRAIYENAPVLIDAFDDNGRCVLWNNECVKTFGWTIEEINDHGDALSLFYPDHEVRNEVIRTVTADPDAQFREWHPKTKDGRTLDTMWANFTLPDGLIFSIGYDITERKDLESKLLQTQKMESIGNLAGGIAHDFNNILSPILGYTEILLEDLGQYPKAAADLQEILKASHRAKDLVKQILTFARQSDDELQPILVQPIVKEVVKFLRSSIPVSISIEANIKSDSLILGNPTQLHQVLMNLCTNAQQAIVDEEGTIRIVVEDVLFSEALHVQDKILSPGNYVKLTVHDDGTGIEPRLLQNIFEPYFTTKESGKGTGLGLAITYGIIERSGGYIQVESSVCRGTTFSIFWPEVKNLHKNTTPEESRDLLTGRGKILLVDDEIALVQMGSKILQRLGYDVTSCTDSSIALEMVLDNPTYFDLVITDMTMPHLSGDKLVLKIRKVNQKIPIVLCTGYSRKVNKDSYRDFGISAYLSKPYSKKDLSDLVFDILNGKK